MRRIKLILLGIVWEIALWCLERIFIMLDWVEPMYEELCRDGEENNPGTE